VKREEFGRLEAPVKVSLTTKTATNYCARRFQRWYDRTVADRDFQARAQQYRAFGCTTFERSISDMETSVSGWKIIRQCIEHPNIPGADQRPGRLQAGAEVRPGDRIFLGAVVVSLWICSGLSWWLFSALLLAGTRINAVTDKPRRW
jgi:hypothetical protein